jgi:hypothetical protein
MARDEELGPEIAEQVGEAKAQSAGGNDAWSGQGWLPSGLQVRSGASSISRHECRHKRSGGKTVLDTGLEFVAVLSCLALLSLRLGESSQAVFAELIDLAPD